MSKTAKIIIGLIVIILIIWGISSASKGTKETASSSTEPIKIGVVAPLSGDAAPYGEPVRNGVMIAVDTINATGGINSRKVEVIYEDGKCDGKAASSATQKLISIDKVKAIVGMPCSGEVLSSAPITEAAKVILLVQGSNPDITTMGDYLFRVFPSDAYTGVAIAEKVLADNFTKVAVLTENTPYAVSIEKTFTDGLTSGKGSLVAKDNYNPDVKDFRSILLKIKAANPQALFINAQVGASATRIAQQAREAGIKAQFYTAFFTGADFVKAGPAVEGTYVVDVPTVGSSSPVAQDFLSKYAVKSNNNSSYIIFGGGAYDEFMLLAQAIGKVGYDADKIKDYLYSLPSYSGAIGTFHFDKNGDVVGINLRWTQVKNGELQVLQ